MKLLLLAMVLVISLSGCDKEPTFSNYDTIEAAQEMIEKGWVPSGLPDEITDIHETHDLETNKGNGTFVLKQDYVIPFVSVLNPIEKDDVLAKDVLPLSSWDEEAVRKQIENDEMIVGEKNGFVYAVSKEGKVYYWVH